VERPVHDVASVPDERARRQTMKIKSRVKAGAWNGGVGDAS
jgi:hypothetical protein